MVLLVMETFKNKKILSLFVSIYCTNLRPYISDVLTFAILKTSVYSGRKIIFQLG